MAAERSLPEKRNPLVAPKHTPQRRQPEMTRASPGLRLTLASQYPHRETKTWADRAHCQTWSNQHVKCYKARQFGNVRLRAFTRSAAKRSAG